MLINVFIFLYTIPMWLERLLFPRRCIYCRRSWGAYVCDVCLRTVPYSGIHYCPECAKPAYGGLTHPHCNHNLLDGHISITLYEGVMRLIIEYYKRRQVKRLDEHISEITQQYLFDEENLFPYDESNCVVVPVPTYWFDRWWRPYDVGFEYSSIVSRALGLPLESKVLVKTHPTLAQKDLSKKQRLQNIQNAFDCPQQIVSAHIILVDDIWTTGATMRECARVLKRNGAEYVWGITLCRGI